MKKQIITTIIFLVFFIAVNAQGAINGITVSQGEGANLRLVDISFNLTGDDAAYDITLAVSFNDGVDYVAIDNANVTGSLLVAPGNNINLVWDGRVNYSTQIVDLTRIKITATTHFAIGDEYQGGKIAYILQSGDPGYDANVDHGLIAAVSNHSTTVPWGCRWTEINGADGLTIGTGAQNTLDILADCGIPGIAAEICADYSNDGYDDWYLPSRDELKKLYVNRGAIGGFVSNYYWTSSEAFSYSSWFVDFSDGYSFYMDKNVSWYVRPVRSF